MPRHNRSRTAPKSQPQPESILRIIGGQWRSRKIAFSPEQGLRPTPDRVRETLFNWLQGVTIGARCLDLFSGSGALGFEALSRGANHLCFVDRSAAVVRAIKEGLATLKAQNAEVINASAIEWLTSLPTDQCQGFDLVFLDPPFRKGLLTPAAELLESKGLLNDGAMIYIETEAELETLQLPANWQLHREKRAGQVMYRLYERISA